MIDYIFLLAILLLSISSYVIFKVTDYQIHISYKNNRYNYGYADFETFTIYFYKYEFEIDNFNLLTNSQDTVITEYKFMFNGNIMIMNNIFEYNKARKFIINYCKNNKNKLIKW